MANQTAEIRSKTGQHHPFFSKNTRGCSSPGLNEAVKELSKCYPSLKNPYLPAFVDFCVGMIEQHGLDSVGIYRIPGNNASVSAVQKRFTSISNSYNLALKASLLDEKNHNCRCDVAAYASALKQFFRTLPDPLFPFELYEGFLEANNLKTNRDRMLGLRKQIQKLPKWNYETMRFLTNHLNSLTLHYDTNKMDVRNLAVIFGPTLMRRPSSSSVFGKKPFSFSSSSSHQSCADMKRNAADTLDQCLVVQTIITHNKWFFDDNAKSVNVPEDLSRDTSTTESPRLHHIFSSLNNSLSVGEVRSFEDASSGASSPSRSSPKLRVPSARSLAKSEPNIPAQLKAEEDEEKESMKNNNKSNTKQHHWAFGHKFGLKKVRNIFRKASSESAKKFSESSFASSNGKMNSLDSPPQQARHCNVVVTQQNERQTSNHSSSSDYYGSTSSQQTPLTELPQIPPNRKTSSVFIIG